MDISDICYFLQNVSRKNDFYEFYFQLYFINNAHLRNPHLDYIIQKIYYFLFIGIMGGVNYYIKEKYEKNNFKIFKI